MPSRELRATGRGRVHTPARVAVMFALMAGLALRGPAPLIAEPMDALGEAVEQEAVSTEGAMQLARERLDASLGFDDAACLACHDAMVQESGAEVDAKGSSGVYALHASLTCMSCHPQDDAFAQAHEQADEKTEKKLKKLHGLKKTSIDVEVCQVCHGDWTDLAALTEQSAVLTDANGLVVNPHLVTAGLNVSGQHGAIACTSCHSVHGSKYTLVDQSQRLCLQCHHTNTYECYTCHS